MTEKEKYISRISGNNKERDYKILEHHALYPEKGYLELMSDLGIDISEARITQILKENIILKNELILILNPLSHKEGRIAEYIKEYRKKSKFQELSKKDKIEMLEGIRKELDDTPLIDNSKHIYNEVRVVIDDKNGRDTDIPPASKSRLSISESKQVSGTSSGS